MHNKRPNIGPADYWSLTLPSFMFVNASVSEIRESNLNKKEEEKEKKKIVENFNTFPDIFLVSVTFKLARSLVHHKVASGILPIYTVLPYCVIRVSSPLKGNEQDRARHTQHNCAHAQSGCNPIKHTSQGPRFIDRDDVAVTHS